MNEMPTSTSFYTPPPSPPSLPDTTRRGESGVRMKLKNVVNHSQRIPELIVESQMKDDRKTLKDKNSSPNLKTGRSRHRTSFDPMIQTTENTSSNSNDKSDKHGFENLLDSLSLSNLSLDCRSRKELHDSNSEHSPCTPMLRRRRSRSSQVESMVSKAVNSLISNRKSGKKSTDVDYGAIDATSAPLEQKRQTQISGCEVRDGEDLCKCAKSFIASPAEKSNSQSSLSEKDIPSPVELRGKKKGGRRRQKNSRMSDTGILGHLGLCESTKPICVDIDTNSNISPPASPIEDRVDSSKETDQIFSKENESIYFEDEDSVNSTFSLPALSAEDNNDTTFETQSSLLSDENYSDDEYIEDDSNIVPEKLWWKGTMLHPDGTVTDAINTSSDEDTEDEESDHICIKMHEACDVASTSSDTRSDVKVKDTKRIASRKAVNREKASDFFIDDCQPQVDLSNEDDDLDVVEVENVNKILRPNTNESSSTYSTDTDHDMSEEKCKSDSITIIPSTRETLSQSSAVTAHQSVMVSANSHNTFQQEHKSVILPRFKINPGVSTEKGKARSQLDISVLSNDSTTMLSPMSSLTNSAITYISKHEVVKQNRWSLGSQIGSGSFGVVHVGMNNLTGNLMAVKVMENIGSSQKLSQQEDLQREVDLMRTLSHPNIVRYFGAERKGDTLYIFQEWVPGGSLSSLLKKFGPFTLSVIRRYLYQILHGLNYLHSNRILHRDIKGGNILVDDRGTIKLADFGASKKLSSSAFMGESNPAAMMQSMTVKGTPYFMAPEVFEQKYNKKADIWSVGGVILQMLTGQPPWKSLGFQSPMSLFYHLKSTDGAPPIETEIISKTLKNIVVRCFDRQVKQRPSTEELLEHPFFKEEEEEEIDEDFVSAAGHQNIEKEKKEGIVESNSTNDDHEHLFTNAMKNITNKGKKERRHKTKSTMKSGCNKSEVARVTQKAVRFDNENDCAHSALGIEGEKRTMHYKSRSIREEAKPLQFVSDDWPSWARDKVASEENKSGMNPYSSSRSSNPFN